MTRPSAAMRRAMAEAEVGDDVLDGDPTVGRLESAAAEWLGKEGALFVPSGTMANQIALGVWTRPGDEVIVERGAHVVSYEAGALAALHGVQSLTLEGSRGALDPDEVWRAIRFPSIHSPRTTLLAVEQTHMSAGGCVLPLHNLRALRALTIERGLSLHLDGARLPNAVVRSGEPASRWAACADSVSVCLSKGLGAPVGSIIAGDGAFLERALPLRKRFGGWMRQSGILAAAGLLALEQGLERLAADHDLARELARALGRFGGLGVEPDTVETNICMVAVRDARWSAPTLAAALEEHGVLAMALGPSRLRFMTHMDVGPSDVEKLVGALDELLA